MKEIDENYKGTEEVYLQVKKIIEGMEKENFDLENFKILKRRSLYRRVDVCRTP